MRTLTLVPFAATALMALAACDPPLPAPAPDGAAPSADAAAVDSIVLERGRCFGTCPAYRVSIAADGRVAFTSSYPVEGRTETGSTTPAAFRELVQAAAAAGFDALPERIATDRALCPSSPTDFPSATVTVFAPGRTKRVVDYLGCREGADAAASARLAALRAFEARVDSVAGTSRWLPPPRR